MKMKFPLPLVSQNDEQLADGAPLYNLSQIIVLNPLNNFKNPCYIHRSNQILVYSQAQLQYLKQFCQKFYIAKVHLSQYPIQVQFSLQHNGSMQRIQSSFLDSLKSIRLKFIGSVFLLQDFLDVD